MSVNFYFEKPTTLKERNRLKLFIGAIFRAEGTKVKTITYIFCSDAHLLGLNRQFLKHDYYTDIITFDLSDTKTAPKAADIYISVDRVKENAKTQNFSISTELHRVIFHGILHLCGYKDKTVAEKRQMRSREDYYLEKYRLQR